MKRIIVTVCAASLLAVAANGASAAQKTWVGMMTVTKDTSASGCGDEPGNKHKFYYRPHIDANDPPSALVVDFGDTTAYLENRDPAAQFAGNGQLTAAAILHRQVQYLPKAKGSYAITKEPMVVDANTQTIRITSGKVTFKVDLDGDTVAESCVFQFRGIMTPDPGNGM